MRKKHIRTFTLAMAFLFIPLSTSAVEMTSTNYQITTNVISGGGGQVESSTGNYKGVVTIGQPTPLMDQNDIPVPPQSTNYKLYPGFLYTTAAGCFGDSEPDGDVDGVDLNAFIQALTLDPTLDVDVFAGAFGTTCQ